MGSKKKGRFGRWHYEYKDDGAGPSFKRRGSCRTRKGGATNNWAFEEYREETLRRLEEEQAEFNDFLDRLRHAEDKAQFERFMDERRNRASDDNTVDGEAEDITPENMTRPSGGPAPQPSA